MPLVAAARGVAIYGAVAVVHCHVHGVDAVADSVHGVMYRVVIQSAGGVGPCLEGVAVARYLVTQRVGGVVSIDGDGYTVRAVAVVSSNACFLVLCHLGRRVLLAVASPCVGIADRHRGICRLVALVGVQGQVYVVDAVALPVYGIIPDDGVSAAGIQRLAMVTVTIAFADYYILNNGTKEDVIERLKEILEKDV